VNGLTIAEKRRRARELLARGGDLFRTMDMFMLGSDPEHTESERFGSWVREVEAAGLFTFEAPRDGPARAEVELRRARLAPLRCLNFAAYNYLGYSSHPEVVAAAKAALDRVGLGACASPLSGGTLEVHAELERELLEFLALPGRGVSLFSSGYAVNVGAIAAYVRHGHHVVLDRAAHMSIVEGAQFSGAHVAYFEHNDPASLESVLASLTGKRVLVCAEGAYSADGDFGRLAELVAVAKRHRAAVLVDEAHSILLAGPNGRGVAEAQGVLDQVDLLVMTFSKAFGGIGGALVARTDLARYVNWYARCRMFSCALDPAVAGGVTRALQLARGADGAKRRARIAANAAYLRDRLRTRLDIGVSESWIVPVIYGSERLSLPLIDWLQRNGLDGSPMQFPAVPTEQARIRLFVTSEHTREELDRAAAIMLEAGERFKFARPA
jgi:glycine C-acetyltransferase